MPQSSYKDSSGKIKYNNLFHAITKEARNQLNDEVMKAYENALDETQQNSEEIEEAEDDEVMVQTM